MFTPVKITDVTLRDGQDDFVHKLLVQEDLTRLAGILDRAGFYSIDCWGGSTFYATLTEMKEDPWQRLRRLRRALPNTPIQMIVRGRMLVGFKPYHAEVVRKFITRAAHFGVDILRVYDNLNDPDNMAVAVDIGKELRKQVEATVLISQNPHITIDDYLNIAGRLVNLGADVICFNDSFGVLTPLQVATLVGAYKRYFSQPVRLHLHDNLQAAVACCQEGVRRGAEMVDTLMADLSWPYGPPPLQSLMFSLGGTRYDPNIDMDVLGEVSEFIEHLKDKYHYQEPAIRKPDDLPGPSTIPGLLKDFIREELIRREARDRQSHAFKEGHQVWADLGYPALKGRILEIVGLQAVENTLSRRRYDTLIPSLVDLLKGKFGRLHTPVTLELQHRVLGWVQGVEDELAEEGQLLERPDLEREEDLLTYTLFPAEAETFFTYRTRSAGQPRLPQPLRQPYPFSVSTANLVMVNRGEEVAARLEGVGGERQGKQVLFINIHDNTEEILVQLAPGDADKPEYLVTMHGDTFRIRVAKTFPRDQEYTPVFLEINGQVEEFLIKTGKG
jgi:pyruvate carboxylase subunit B